MSDYVVQEKALVMLLAVLENEESPDERLNTAFMIGQTVYIMNQVLVENGLFACFNSPTNAVEIRNNIGTIIALVTSRGKQAV